MEVTLLVVAIALFVAVGLVKRALHLAFRLVLLVGVLVLFASVLGK